MLTETSERGGFKPSHKDLERFSNNPMGLTYVRVDKSQIWGWVLLLIEASPRVHSWARPRYQQSNFLSQPSWGNVHRPLESSSQTSFQITFASSFSSTGTPAVVIKISFPSFLFQPIETHYLALFIILQRP